MKWQIIPAMLLILALLSGMAGWAEELGQIVTPTPAAEASGDAAQSAPETTLPPAADPAERAPLYYVLMDCGYAFYGSDEFFDRSVAAQPGDPDGALLKMLEQCFTRLAPENAMLVLRGYHSEAVGSAQPAPVSDEAAVQARFAALQGAHSSDNKSSMLDAVLEALSAEIAGFAAEYDCTLVLVTGGCVNYYKGEPDSARLMQALSDVRAAGATIRAFGLAGETIEDNLSAFFNPGEYTAEQIVPTEMDDGYSAARTAMMADLAQMLAQSAGTQVVAGTPGSRESAMALLQGGSADDAVLAFYWRNAEGNRWVLWNNEELQSYLDRHDVFSVYNDCTFVVLKGVYQPNKTKLAAEQKAREQLIGDLTALSGELSEALASRMDVADGEQRFDLPAGYDAQKASVSSTNPAVLGAAAADGVLTLRPVSAGEAAVQFTVEGAEAPIEAAVCVVDSRMVWSFEDGASLTAASGQLLENGAPVSLSVSASGDLCWTIADGSGHVVSGSTIAEADAGADAAASDDHDENAAGAVSDEADEDAAGAVSAETDANESGAVSDEADANESGAVSAEADANAAESAPADGMRAELTGDGAQRTVSFTADAIGTYEVTVRVCDGGTELNCETRAFSVHRPADPMDEASLTWPYFRQQDGQRVMLTSGGAPANLADYEIAVEPAGVLEVYAFTDGAGMYLVPVGAGAARVTLTEKGVDNPAAVSMTVRVNALTANAMLWLCIAGAAVCLIALTAAIVIVIGKCARRSD